MMNHRQKYKIAKFFQPKASVRLLAKVLMLSFALAYGLLWMLATMLKSLI